MAKIFTKRPPIGHQGGSCGIIHPNRLSIRDVISKVRKSPGDCCDTCFSKLEPGPFVEANAGTVVVCGGCARKLGLIW